MFSLYLSKESQNKESQPSKKQVKLKILKSYREESSAAEDDSPVKIVDKENNKNMMNLAADDGYNMKILSESDDEYHGNRIRTYSYDPDKDEEGNEIF